MTTMLDLMKPFIVHHFGDDTDFTPDGHARFEVKLAKLPNWSFRKRIVVTFDDDVIDALRADEAAGTRGEIDKVGSYLAVRLAGKFSEWGTENVQAHFRIGSEALDV
ncbi:hypothetical protein P3G55_17390 [Leptospira sp. 96542]|nr:hypothetical protein [Leptospira sp. 96542]